MLLLYVRKELKRSNIFINRLIIREIIFISALTRNGLQWQRAAINCGCGKKKNDQKANGSDKFRFRNLFGSNRLGVFGQVRSESGVRHPFCYFTTDRGWMLCRRGEMPEITHGWG